MRCHHQLLNLFLAMALLGPLANAFTPSNRPARTVTTFQRAEQQDSKEESSRGVVELGDDNDSDSSNNDADLPTSVGGPLFISQGEVDPDTLNPDFSNAKQTRVIIYTILSLLPVLFLIPFMLGRDFIAADSLPPVEMMQ